jgi:hypothetical protein
MDGARAAGGGGRTEGAKEKGFNDGEPSDRGAGVEGGSGQWLDALVVGVVVQNVSFVYSSDRSSAGGVGEADEATVHECIADAVTPLGGEQDRHGREQGLVVGAEVLVESEEGRRVAVITAMHMHYLVRYMKENTKLVEGARGGRASIVREEAHAKVAPQQMREVLEKGQLVLMTTGPGQASTGQGSAGQEQGQGQYTLVRVVTVRVTCLVRHEADVDCDNDDGDGEEEQAHTIVRHRQGAGGDATMGMGAVAGVGFEGAREWMELSEDTCFGVSVALRNLSRVQGGRAKLVRSGCVQAVVLLFSYFESKMASAAAATAASEAEFETPILNDGVITEAEKAVAEQQERRRRHQQKERQEEAHRLRQKVVANCHEASVNMALDGAESSSSRFVHKGGGILLVKLLSMAAHALVARQEGKLEQKPKAEQETSAGQLQGTGWARSFLSSVTKAAAQVSKPEGTRPRLASEGIVPPLVAILGAYEPQAAAKGIVKAVSAKRAVDLGVVEQAALALCRMALPDTEYLNLRAGGTGQTAHASVHDVRRALLRAKRLFGHRVPLELIRPLQEALSAIDPGVTIAPA